MSEHNNNSNSPQNTEEISNEVPLGNYSPLPVHQRLGQSFLQFKFIYPLGAVSILSPNALGDDEQILGQEFEPLSNSLGDTGVENTLQRLVNDSSIDSAYTDGSQSNQSVTSSSNQSPNLQTEPDYLNKSKILPQPIAKSVTVANLQAKSDPSSGNQLKTTSVRSPAISTTNNSQDNLTIDTQRNSAETISRLVDQNNNASLDSIDLIPNNNRSENAANLDISQSINTDRLSPKDINRKEDSPNSDNISFLRTSNAPIENSLSRDDGSEVIPTIQRQTQTSNDTARDSLSNVTNSPEINRKLNTDTSQISSTQSTDFKQDKNIQSQQLNTQQDNNSNNNSPNPSISNTTNIDLSSSLDTTIDKAVEDGFTDNNKSIQDASSRFLDLSENTNSNLEINRELSVDTNQIGDIKSTNPNQENNLQRQPIDSPPQSEVTDLKSNSEDNVSVSSSSSELEGIISRKSNGDILDSPTTNLSDSSPNSKSYSYDNTNSASNSRNSENIEEITNNSHPDLNQINRLDNTNSEQTINRKSDSIRSDDNLINREYDLSRQVESQESSINSNQTIENSVSTNHENYQYTARENLDYITNLSDSNTLNRNSTQDNSVNTNTDISYEIQKSDRLNDTALPTTKNSPEISRFSDNQSPFSNPLLETNPNLSINPEISNINISSQNDLDILARKPDLSENDYQRNTNLENPEKDTPIDNLGNTPDSPIVQRFTEQLSTSQVDSINNDVFALPSSPKISSIDSITSENVDNSDNSNISKDSPNNLNSSIQRNSSDSQELLNSINTESDQMTTNVVDSNPSTFSSDIQRSSLSPQQPLNTLDFGGSANISNTDIQRESLPSQQSLNNLDNINQYSNLDSDTQPKNNISGEINQSLPQDYEVVTPQVNQAISDQFLVQRDIQIDQELGMTEQLSLDSISNSQQSSGDSISISKNADADINTNINTNAERSLDQLALPNHHSENNNDSIQRFSDVNTVNSSQQNIENEVSLTTNNPIKSESQQQLVTPSTNTDIELQKMDALPEDISESSIESISREDRLDNTLVQRDLSSDLSAIDLEANTENEFNSNIDSKSSELSKSKPESQLQRSSILNESFAGHNQNVNDIENSIESDLNSYVATNEDITTNDISSSKQIDTSIQLSHENDVNLNTDLFIADNPQVDQADTNIQLNKQSKVISNEDTLINNNSLPNQVVTNIQLSQENTNQQRLETNNQFVNSDNLSPQNLVADELIQPDLDNNPDYEQNIDTSSSLDVDSATITDPVKNTEVSYPKAQDIQRQSPNNYQTSLDTEVNTLSEVSSQIDNNQDLPESSEQNISDRSDNSILQKSEQTFQNYPADNINNSSDVFASSTNTPTDALVVQRQNDSTTISNAVSALPSDNLDTIISTDNKQIENAKIKIDNQSEQYNDSQTDRLESIDQIGLQRKNDNYLSNTLSSEQRTSVSQGENESSTTDSWIQVDKSLSDSIYKPQTPQIADSNIQAEASENFNRDTNTLTTSIQRQQEQILDVDNKNIFEEQKDGQPSLNMSSFASDLEQSLNSETVGDEDITSDNINQSQSVNSVNNEVHTDVEQSLNVQAKGVDSNTQIKSLSELDSNLDSSQNSNLNSNFNSNLSAIETSFSDRISTETQNSVADSKVDSNHNITSETISRDTIDDLNIRAKSFTDTPNIAIDNGFDINNSSTLNIQRELESSSANHNNQAIEQVDPSFTTVKEFNELAISRAENVGVDNYEERSDRQDAVPQTNVSSSNQNQVSDNILDTQIRDHSQEEQTVVQMLASDRSNHHELELPKAVQNIGQTQSLGNFSPLNQNTLGNNAIANSIQKRLLNSKNNIQAKFTKSTTSDQPTNTFTDGLNGNIGSFIDGFTSRSHQSASSTSNNQTTPNFIQKKSDSNFGDVNQTMSSGWSSLSELLNNYPVQDSSNMTANSLNQKTTNFGDRSPLADRSSSQTIQRSPAQSFDNELENFLRNGTSISSSTSSNQSDRTESRSSTNQGSREELYITPSGIQTGDPNQLIQPKLDPSLIQKFDSDESESSSEDIANVEISPNQEDMDEEKFTQNLELIAQEVYVLLKQKIMIERERQGNKYKGRLLW